MSSTNCQRWFTLPANNGFETIDIDMDEMCPHSGKSCYHKTRTSTYIAVASGFRIAELFLERGIPLHPHFEEKIKKQIKR